MTGKKMMQVIRVINILTALLVIVLSVLSLAFVVLQAITSLKFFLIFSPVFMIAFGIAMLAAQFKIRFVLKKLPFLKSLVGRGLFNIYLSSIIYYYFEAAQSTFLAWLGAICLFVSGLIYLGMHIGCGKQIQKQQQKGLNNQEQKDTTQNFRQPLM